MTDVASLEETIRRLADIEDIKKLTATYAMYVNKGWNGKGVDHDKLQSVFTEDARWTSGQMSASGRDNIVRSLGEWTAVIDFAIHSFTNPIIDVKGDTASGNWLLWVANEVKGVVDEVFQSKD